MVEVFGKDELVVFHGGTVSLRKNRRIAGNNFECILTILRLNDERTVVAPAVCFPNLL